MSAKAHDFTEKERTKDVLIDERLNFNSLLLSDASLQGLRNLGFQKPSPIQLKAVPIGKCGFDLIVKSKSGTGKTLVFALIALELISVNKKGVQALILAPTREIAVQIQGVLCDLGTEHKGLVVESFIGGLPVEEDVAKVSKCHIAVGAPGRVKHLIKLGALKLKDIKLFVLDEIDKLMEQNTGIDILEISDQLPSSKQVIAVSATYSEETEEYLKKIMRAPTFVEPNSSTPLLLGLKQFVTVVKSNLNVVHQMAIKSKELTRILQSVSFTQCLIFSNFQTRAESVSNFLNGKGWQTMYISGAQTQKERLQVMEDLKSGKCRVLLSTDLTARGIDASNVDLIINYDVPYSASTYLHRMGRAGRFGSKGVCISIVADGKETTDFQKILGDIAGANFSICKLPQEDLPNDLLTFDTKSLDVINSILDADNSKELKRILESVSEIKASSKKVNKKESKKDDKKVTKDENKELLNVESIQNMLQNNKLIDDQIESFDGVVPNLLQSIADGDVKMDEFKTPEISEFDANALLSIIASGCSTEQTTAEKSAEDQSSNSSEQTTDSTSTKRKRRKSKRKPNAAKEKTVLKNMALLNVAKLLANPAEQDAREVSTVLERYLENSDDNTDGQAKLDEQKANKVLKMIEMGEDPLPELMENDRNLENIFQLSYDYALKPNAPYWLDVLGDTLEDANAVEPVEEKEVITFFRSPKRRCKSNRKSSYKRNNYEEEYVDQKLDMHVDTYDENVLQAHESKSAEMIEPNAISGYELENPHFAECFQRCSDDLSASMQTFEDMPTFENWYQQWQWQVQSVRDYVQQNVYMQEMNKYYYGQHY